MLFREGDLPVRISWSTLPPIAHYHSELEVSITLRGHGRYFVKDTVYELYPGSGLIVHGQDIHYGFPIEKGGLLRAVLMFSPALLESRPAALKKLEELTGLTTFTLSSTETNNIELLIRNIEDEKAGKRDGWKDIICSELERFLLTIGRAALESSEKVKVPNSIIKDVIYYLNNTYAKKQSVADIAKECCISQSTLRRAFRQETGLGVKEFIIQIRINAAKKLLEDSDTKVAAVAYSVGYDSLSAFNREFRLVTGISPSDYRRSTR